MKNGLSKLGLSTIILSATSISVSGHSRPNIVYILADDLGYECLGAYGSTYKTPNLDALAQEGMLYNNCHAMPLSSPTRVQTMTGRYNYKNYEKFGYMNPREKTFGNLAKDAGYSTAIVGKWQLEGDLTYPKMWGFDQYCLWEFTLPKEAGERYANAPILINGELAEHNIDTYGPDVFESFAEEFISKNRDKPFFLYYPMVLVHKPFTPTPDCALWQEEENRLVQDKKNFPQMVQYMDKMVGRLIQKLKDEGVYDNTIIIFTGDNGTQKDLRTPMKDGRLIRGGKSTTRDAGTHVPLIVNWPMGAKQGRVMEQLVDVTDFLPTFADAMGVKVPKEWDTDGISILPQIKGDKRAPQREWTLCHYDTRWEGFPSDKATRSVRTVRYKLYQGDLFYDLQNDIYEKTPLPIAELDSQAKSVYTMLNGVLNSLPSWSNANGVNKSDIPKLKQQNQL